MLIPPSIGYPQQPPAAGYPGAAPAAYAAGGAPGYPSQPAGAQPPPPSGQQLYGAAGATVVATGGSMEHFLKLQLLSRQFPPLCKFQLSNLDQTQHI